MPKTLAKKYDIRVYHQDGCKVITEEENLKRYVKFPLGLDGVNKIEITLRQSYGEECGIYGVYYTKKGQ